MNDTQKAPVRRDDDGELLGFVADGNGSWEAQTIFGYVIERTTDRSAAERIVREQGLGYLTGVWQYFDRDDRQWHACVLKEAYEHQVTVIRTTPMGYQDPDDYKLMTLSNPDETNLIKN